MKFRLRNKSIVVNVIIILIIIASLFQCSCTSIMQNSTSSFSIEKTFETSVYGMGLPLQIAQSGPWELGVSFVVHREAKIIGIRIKNPELGQKRVSLWDAIEHRLLATYTFNITDSQNYNLFLIEMPLQKGKTYSLTMNCVEYYYHNLPFDRLPLHNENITLLQAVYGQGSWQDYPRNIEKSVVHGLIDIDVQYKIH